MRRGDLLAISLCGALALASTGCAPAADDAGPRGDVTITVAPLGLAGVTDARYTLTVTNAQNGGGDVVWQRTGLSSDQYGDGAGSLSYVGTCDAATGESSVRLDLEGLYEGAGVLIDEATYLDPTPITLNVACVEDADVAVDFDLTIARAAEQGFFDVSVSFDDIFCSAKLDCVKSGTTEDLLLLHNADGARDLTAVLGFACTASITGEATYLYLDDPVITCDGLTDPIRVDVSGVGNVDLDADPSVNVDGYLFAAQVTRGAEGLAGKVYWNVAFGLNHTTEMLTQAQSCTLTAHATASRAVLDETAYGFTVPPGSAYPVVTWDVELTNESGRVCASHELDAPGSGVATGYAGPGIPSAAPGLFRCGADASAAGCIGDPCPGFHVPGENTCVYPFTGAPEAFTVPVGVTSLDVKLWGGGGGAGGSTNGGYRGGNGGAGAFVSGALGVTPGASLTVEVGGGGAGSAGAASNATGGDGGGSSRLLDGATPLTIAGAGGGGGGTWYDTVNSPPTFQHRGWNAGAAGQNGESALTGWQSSFPGWSGFAGTASAGGARGAGTNTVSIWYPGTAGAYLAGGRGGGSSGYGAVNATWPDGGGNGWGGGGGGGRYGGGGGGTHCGGGGGGSSLAPAGTTLQNGSWTTPGGASDPERDGAGAGGLHGSTNGSAGGDGAPGRVIIRW